MKYTRKTYILVFFLLLAIETFIALFVNDAIIRPYMGDVLVIFLMYVFIRGVVLKPIRFLPVYLLIFASFVELAQYFHIVDILNLNGNRVASTIIGNSFDIKDVLCYLIATITLIILEKAGII